MITPRHPAENLSIVHQTQTATQLANLNRNGRKPGARNKPSGVAERVRRSAAAKTALCIRTLAALRPPPSPERCRCHAAAAAFDLRGTISLRRAGPHRGGRAWSPATAPPPSRNRGYPSGGRDRRSQAIPRPRCAPECPQRPQNRPQRRFPARSAAGTAGAAWRPDSYPQGGGGGLSRKPSASCGGPGRILVSVRRSVEDTS